MSRLGTIVAKILAARRTMGSGLVSQIVRPGEVRLEGRQERVLVAGNVSPSVGERVAWLRLDRETLVTAKNLRSRMPVVLRADVAGKVWQQVLVNTNSANLGVMLAHRDSSGRHWVKVRRFTPAYYSQETDEFLTPDWTYRGTGWGTSSEAADRSSVMGDGDSFVEVGQSGFISLAVRRLTIAPDTGALSYGTATSLPDRPEGTPLRSSICKDAAGYYHIAVWWSYPYQTDPPKWREVAWVSASPNSITAWTQNLNVLHDAPPDNWRIPLVLLVDDAVVKLGAQKLVVDDVVYDAIRYRICSGGAWSGEYDPGFRGWELDGCGGEDLHITYSSPNGGVEWRRAALSGGVLVWDSPAELLSSNSLAVGAVHQNFEEGSAPVAAWVSNWDREFMRYGLPPGDEEEDLEPLDPLQYSISNGALQAGGGMSTPGTRDGFAAFLQYRTVYAARVVEEDQ